MDLSPVPALPTLRSLQRCIRVEREPAARIFVAPSAEARRLARAFAPLFAPRADGQGWLSRTLGTLLVAPFTQLTLLSFDLQAFLYEVFHQRPAARLGHLLLMPVVNLFLMAGLANVWFGEHPAAHGDVFLGPNLGTAYAAALLLWYGLLARETRMLGWWLATAPVVVGLCVGANLLHAHTFTLDPAHRTLLAPTPLAYNPWLGALAAAALIALSHVPEPKLPPRVTGAVGWISVREYLLGLPGERVSWGERAARALSLGVQLVTGTLNELVASPRLMPYGFLLQMFERGYRPEVRGRLRDHVDRALRSGNPAIDYVGVGGGTWLNAEVL